MTVLLSPPMWKKALTPVSVIVLLVGVGLIVYSSVGGDDSGGDANVTEISVVDESTTTGPSDSAAPSATTVAPAAATTVAPPTSAESPGSSFIPSFPTIVLPSSTLVIPSLPGISPSFSIAPGVIDALSCNSFQACAQKLYQSWKDGTLNTATLYATQAAVNTLQSFAFGYGLFGPWPGNVTQTSPTTFRAKSNAPLLPRSIIFNFTAGQTGFKVQSVQIL